MSQLLLESEAELPSVNVRLASRKDNERKKSDEIKQKDTLLHSFQSKNSSILGTPKLLRPKHSREHRRSMALPSTNSMEEEKRWLEKVKEMMYELLGTLAYMHGKNICHRDIKPENIMLDLKNCKQNSTKSIECSQSDDQTSSKREISLKIIDFGISKSVTRRSKKYEMLTITGTLYYRAPEMFSGGGYDQTVDIWAAGVLLFKIVTSKTPFESVYISETIQNIRNGLIDWSDFCSNSQQESSLLIEYKSARDLIERMLRVREERLSAAECLKHHWFYSLRRNINTVNCLTRSYQFFPDPQAKKEAQMYLKGSYWMSPMPGNDRGSSKPLGRLDTKDLNLNDMKMMMQSIKGDDYHFIQDSQDCESQEEENKGKSPKVEARKTSLDNQLSDQEGMNQQMPYHRIG